MSIIDHPLTTPKPRWIMGLRDLPDATGPAHYRVTAPDGTRVEAVLSGRKRQLVAALALGPVFCASPVRLSDIVHRLKRDHDIAVTTKTAVDGRKFYSLPGRVERIGGGN